MFRRQQDHTHKALTKLKLRQRVKPSAYRTVRLDVLVRDFRVPRSLDQRSWDYNYSVIQAFESVFACVTHSTVLETELTMNFNGKRASKLTAYGSIINQLPRKLSK